MRGSVWGKLLYLAGMQRPLPFLHFPTAVDLGALHGRSGIRGCKERGPQVQTTEDEIVMLWASLLPTITIQVCHPRRCNACSSYRKLIWSCVP